MFSGISEAPAYGAMNKPMIKTIRVIFTAFLHNCFGFTSRLANIPQHIALCQRERTRNSEHLIKSFCSSSAPITLANRDKAQ